MEETRARKLEGAAEMEDEKLLRAEEEQEAVPSSLAGDSWRVFRIMGEFVEGFEGCPAWERRFPSSVRPGCFPPIPSTPPAGRHAVSWGRPVSPSSRGAARA
jgi:hypothetical protein